MCSLNKRSCGFSVDESLVEIIVVHTISSFGLLFVNAEVVSGTSDAADSDNTSDDDSDGSTSTFGRSIIFNVANIAGCVPLGVNGSLPGVPVSSACASSLSWGNLIFSNSWWGSIFPAFSEGISCCCGFSCSACE